ncbi:hypothetical protein V1L54_05875 [Streptomyces sp. TRM 70361]|uniref:hypothetical protein n=1 Tax=Streptomyces sp. TRM 70361 TaxID=3116553 RepID=UPI002E7C257D|nr:hypothetical protein [Streptomyces sp. TRM 70361]MEE1938946.1 hypothetical protein [Streptomyces sp. TRM 70361]
MRAGHTLRVAALTPAGAWTAEVRTAPAPHRSAVAAPFADVHVCADPDRRGAERWYECADVLSARRPLPARRAECRAADLLARHPGCLVAAVPRTDGGCAAGVRGRGLLAVLPPAGTVSLSARQRCAIASFLHAWLVAGRPVDALCAVGLGVDGWSGGGAGGLVWARVVRRADGDRPGPAPGPVPGI